MAKAKKQSATNKNSSASVEKSKEKQATKVPQKPLKEKQPKSNKKTAEKPKTKNKKQTEMQKQLEKPQKQLASESQNLEQQPDNAQTPVAKEKTKKLKPQPSPVYETVEEIKPILRAQQTDINQTLYFDSNTAKPLYGPAPAYFEPTTGKPMFTANQQGVKVVQTQVDVSKRKPKTNFSFASSAVLMAGLLFFSICFFMVSLTANTESGVFWGIIILTWLFGPIMMITIPPICYLIGVILMFIGFFKAPKGVYTWVAIPVNALILTGGIYLFITYLPYLL